MAFNWNKFPWTNLHDLNLDWIIQTVKTLENNLADAVGKFTEIVNTAVGAERTERIAKDEEIQAEIATEVYPAISKSITDTLTGSGDLTINKTGDVRISGNSVQLTGGTVVSDGTEQLTLRNPNSNTSMTANYNSGVLTLRNNQNGAAGVALYAINTPADGGGDNSDFAANVGYVKAAVAAVDSKLDTEITNRTSGDAALQSTIDNVIMPLLTKVEKRAPHVVYMVIGDVTAYNTVMTDEQITPIKTALLNHTPVMLCVDSSGDGAQFFYHLDNCVPEPDSNNINSALSLTFKTVSGSHTATLDLSTKTIVFS